MAIAAGRAEIAAVRIVLDVARIALGFGGVKRRLVSSVTAFTGELRVLAEQRKASGVMVEAPAIEAEDVGVTALVLGVAVGARCSDDLGGAVKSRALVNVGRYLRVAAETEVLLLPAPRSAHDMPCTSLPCRRARPRPGRSTQPLERSTWACAAPVTAIPASHARAHATQSRLRRLATPTPPLR